MGICVKHRFLVYVSILFLLISCDKDKKNSIHIEGKIFDPNTSEYVEDAEVIIAASKLSSGGIFSSGYEDIASTSTDANGTFIFDFSEDKFAGYQIRVSKPDYFGLIKDIPTSDIQAGITFSPTYNIYPIGYINLKIRNVMPYDTNDLVSYSYTSGYLSGYDCCDNTLIQGHGLFFADTVFCKTHGNQNVAVTYNVTKNGTTHIYTQTKYCSAFDTTYFIIDY
ncbi:MAG TPA: hypothetical protein PKI01_11865 [Bacteroidales bacterium]|mgnify:CR=1 FL=1|nr:hypothetical protein [Bacteroidales bacterium]